MEQSSSELQPDGASEQQRNLAAEQQSSRTTGAGPNASWHPTLPSGLRELPERDPTQYDRLQSSTPPARAGIIAPGSWDDGGDDGWDVDEDCDGAINEDSAFDASLWYRDYDADGYGDATETTWACTQPNDYASDASDCDDGDDEVNPGATETCDGQDEDCDGLADSDDLPQEIWYLDRDGDGYGDLSTSAMSCAQPDRYVGDASDCDDDDAAVFPNATELCNTYDDDCDGDIDEHNAVPATWYADVDQDGYGDPTDALTQCAPPVGYCNNDDDCDDTNPYAAPGLEELCDGFDNDCNGQIDEAEAADAGTWYLDADADGYGNDAVSEVACDAPGAYVADSTDCNDSAGTVHPGATELCDSANVDEDCDLLADDADADVDASGRTTWYLDGDADTYGGPEFASYCDLPSGYSAVNTDCDDGLASINPGATEVCDSANTDEDCDGLADDADGSADASGKAVYYEDADGDSYGSSIARSYCDQPASYSLNSDDCDDTDVAINPDAPEVCDGSFTSTDGYAGGVDNDCDGSINERPALSSPEWYVDNDGDGYGGGAGVASCSRPVGYLATRSDCDDAEPLAWTGAPDVCDSVDNDCNGAVDDFRDVQEGPVPDDDDAGSARDMGSEEAWVGEQVALGTLPGGDEDWYTWVGRDRYDGIVSLDDLVISVTPGSGLTEGLQIELYGAAENQDPPGDHVESVTGDSAGLTYGDNETTSYDRWYLRVTGFNCASSYTLTLSSGQ